MIYIEHILKEKGITKIDLAKKMELSRESLYRIIKGNPTLENIKKIAAALEVNPARLFSGVNGFVEINGTIHKITSKEDLEKVLDLID